MPMCPCLQGDRAALLREIERLRIELAGMHQGTTEPLIEVRTIQSMSACMTIGDH